MLAAAALGKCRTKAEATAIVDILERTPKAEWAATLATLALGAPGGGNRVAPPSPKSSNSSMHRHATVPALRLGSDTPVNGLGANITPRTRARGLKSTMDGGTTTPRIDAILARRAIFEQYSPRQSRARTTFNLVLKRVVTLGA